MMIWTRKKGFTLVEIMIVVAIIGLLAAIAIPNFANARRTAATSACKANLRQLMSSATAYSADNEAFPSSYADLSAKLIPDYIRSIPHCPSNTSANYGYDAATANVNCPVNTTHNL